MTRRKLAMAALASLSIAAAACSTSSTGVTTQSTNKVATSQPTTTTTSATPKVATVSTLMAGTAKPVLPALVAGKVSVTAGAPAASGDSTDLPVTIVNGTRGYINHLDVTAAAVSGSGSVDGSGDSQGITPVNLGPGQAAFGFVFFENTPPAGDTYNPKVTYDSGKSDTDVDLQVQQANSNNNADLPGISGQVMNPSSVKVSSPVAVQVYCFSATGIFTDAESGFTDGNGDIAPQGTGTYTVTLGDTTCPAWLVGASAYTF